ncbi:DNA repair helicase UVH6 [Acorus calamus]|uniref:Regulator of telomere elongation helicase 1 homolog n=1 Tax=Acorus calamus TaxID=4465 RepID=A0AAV9C1W6_ACOCL|nr:DNA repair helicase UVH6 [Acorus calamus]
MPIYKIRGIDVDFPFEAYDSQIVYMDKVIQSLQQRCNALLESPTGTGKTLCLLCATLAWRKSLGSFSTGSAVADEVLGTPPMEMQRPDLPTIIYTSRTHSQLKQVIRELKVSNYRPRMGVLGSREQMCIHEEVQQLSGRAQNNACHYLCKKRACSHHKRVSEYMKNSSQLGCEPFDIEDLVNIGRTKGPCPYYVSRELHKVVDILFAPYNYLINPGNRRSLTGIQWERTVLIFDEAHNLESICADAASFDLVSATLTACITEAKECVNLSTAKRSKEKSEDKSCNPEDFAILRALLLKLEKRISEVVIESRELGFTRSGTYIYEFLSDLNITNETAKMLIGTIDDAAILLEDDDTASKTTEKKALHKTKGRISRLESIRDILEIIFRNGDTSHAKSYRFHVQENQAYATDVLKGKVSRTLSWWCFNPGIAMEEFVKSNVHSIILTSGTLSPMDSFALELNIRFPVRLENPHVISSNQIWVGVVSSGPSGCCFNSSYRNRDSLEYKQDLGNAVVNFARIVPDGLLVFFPSYYMMDKCIECWKNMSHASSTNSSTIWERICKHKNPVIEPKQSALFSRAIEDFEAKLRDPSSSGAVFFAVCRGKVSEGLDFADQSGRAVVITGMPFAMKTDPKIRLKREYLDQQASSQKKENKVLTGEEWYVQQASRAVNQAVGRVIRHRHDYGAIIFCDERFAQLSYQSQMSLWIRPYVKCYPKFGDVVYTLTKFFRETGSCESLKPKLIPSQENASGGKIQQGHGLVSAANIQKLSTASVSKEVCRNPLSSILMASRQKINDQLGVIVPANRSTLSIKRNFDSLKHSTHALYSQKGSRIAIDKKPSCTQSHDSEVVDLTNDSSFDERSCMEDGLPLKKPSEIVSGSIQGAGAGVSVQWKCDVTASEHSSQQKEDNHTASVAKCDAETRGSAFLMQVQEKLLQQNIKNLSVS